MQKQVSIVLGVASGQIRIRSSIIGYCIDSFEDFRLNCVGSRIGLFHANIANTPGELSSLSHLSLIFQKGTVTLTFRFNTRPDNVIISEW